MVRNQLGKSKFPVNFPHSWTHSHPTMADSLVPETRVLAVASHVSATLPD